MTLEHLKNFIKARAGGGPPGEGDPSNAGDGPLCISIGAIDGRRERCIGVYPGKPPARQRVCLGGAQATLTGELYATVLVHWGRNMREAMEKAGELHALFYAWNSETGGRSGADGGAPGRAGGEMDGVRVYAVEPGGGPVFAGRDEHGVCEFAIDLKITFEKECV